MSFVNPPLLFPLRLHVSLLPAVSHPSHRTQPGLVLVLGQGDVGQLGLGQDVMERKKPALVQLPELMVQVEAGGMHTVCLSETGKVSALWGFVGSWGGGAERPLQAEGARLRPGAGFESHLALLGLQSPSPQMLDGDDSCRPRDFWGAEGSFSLLGPPASRASRGASVSHPNCSPFFADLHLRLQ